MAGNAHYTRGDDHILNVTYREQHKLAVITANWRLKVVQDVTDLNLQTHTGAGLSGGRPQPADGRDCCHREQDFKDARHGFVNDLQSAPAAVHGRCW
jgi:hypothetical protein